jgi:hypothetical protein
LAKERVERDKEGKPGGKAKKYHEIGMLNFRYNRNLQVSGQWEAGFQGVKKQAGLWRFLS